MDNLGKSLREIYSSRNLLTTFYRPWLQQPFNVTTARYKFDKIANMIALYLLAVENDYYSRLICYSHRQNALRITQTDDLFS